GTPASIGAGFTSATPLLGIPRDKFGIIENRLTIFPRATGGDPPWMWSNDEGATWDSATGDLGDVDFHAAVFEQAGTGIHYTYPAASPADDLAYRLIAEPCTLSANIGTQRILEAGTFRSTVAARGDTVWVVGRHSGSQLTDIEIYWSIDGFATDTTHVDLTLNNQDHRIHLAADTSGLMHLWVMEEDGAATGSIRIYDWNGTTFNAGANSLVRESSEIVAATRAMTISMADEWHYIHGIGTNLVEYRWNGSTWIMDTVSAGTPSDVNWYPHATARGDSVFLAYNILNASTATIAMKIWDGTNWSDSVIVTGSDNVEQQVQMPALLNDTITYIPIVWVTTDDTVRFNTLKTDLVIASLPFHCTVSDANYIIEGTLHSDDTAIVIDANVDNIRIYQRDKAGDTVYWGEDGDPNIPGIYIGNSNSNGQGGRYCYWGEDGDPNIPGIYIGNSNSNDNTIDSLNLVQNAPADSLVTTFNLNTNAISLGAGVHDLTITNSYVFTHGRSAQIFISNNDCYNITLRGNDWDQQSVAFTQRDLWIDFAALAFGNMNSRNMAGFNYHVAIDRCSTLAANWVNYYFHGAGMEVSLDSSYLYMDARNDFDTAASPLYGSAEQCYLVGIRGGDTAHVQITNNTGRSGTSYAGADGIFVTGTGEDTTTAGSIWLYNNDFVVTKGNAGENETATVIKLRQTAANVRVEGNTIYTMADTTGAQTYLAPSVDGIRLEENPANSGIIIADNDIRVAFLSAVAPVSESIEAKGIEIAGIDSIDAAGMYFRNNKITAGSYCYKLGNNNADIDIARWLTFTGDTLALHDSGTTSQYTIGLYETNALNNDGNVLVDCFFDTASGATISNIQWIAGTGDVSIRSTLSVYADSANSPCEACSVLVVNAYGDTVINWTETGADGTVTGVIPWYWENETIDSLAFNDLAVKARQGTDSATSTYTLGFTEATKNDTLTVFAAGPANSGELTGTASLSGSGAIQ
ncbi:hypothetical protein LCGC14_1392890, partial [marine sediment metagenome]